MSAIRPTHLRVYPTVHFTFRVGIAIAYQLSKNPHELLFFVPDLRVISNLSACNWELLQGEPSIWFDENSPVGLHAFIKRIREHVNCSDCLVLLDELLTTLEYKEPA